MKRALFILTFVIAGCDGGPVTAEDAGSAPTDGGAANDGSTETDSGSPGTDAGMVGADAGPASDGGGMAACGEGPADSLGIPSTCSRIECFDDAPCIDRQLEALGYTGYAACGSRLEIDPSSSNAACEIEPPWGPGETASRCGLIPYSGHVLFFCAPDGSRVVARFSAAFSPPDTMRLYYHLGHEYWAGSGGGSGDSYTLSWVTDDFGERFIGFQGVDIPSSGSTHLDVWFLNGDFTDPMFIAGGFGADVPPM